MYNQILSVDSNEYNVYYSLSGVYEEMDNYSQAIEYKKKYMNLTSTSSNSCISVADLFLNIGQFDSAKIYYEKAEMLNPLDFNPKRSICNMRTIMGDLENMFEFRLCSHCSV